MDQSSPVSPAYAAGFFDADGCVASYIPKRGGPPVLRLDFAQETEEILLDLQETFGGKIRYRGDLPRALVIQGRDAMIDTLEYMLPYLRVKRRRAEIALEMLHLTGTNRWDTTPEANERRLELHHELRSLINGGRIAREAAREAATHS